MTKRSTRREKIRLLGFSVFLVACFFQAQHVFAIEYGGFGGRPAYPREENPRTESIFVHTLEPGSVQDEGVLLINNTATEKTLLVYGADSTPSSGGAFACEQLSQSKDDVGAWITLSRSEVTLASGETEIVPFTITVPELASVGEHNGCILIQEKKDAADGAGVNLSVRTGLRVAVTIPGVIVRDLEITDFQVDRQTDGSGRLLHATVTNNGNVSIDTNIDVTISTLLGKELISYGGEYPILRGETSDWSFELQKPFWGGFLRAHLGVEYDKSSEASVGIVSGEDVTRLEGPTIWFFVLPSLPGAMIELLIFLAMVICAGLFILARKRKQWVQTHWLNYTVAEGENVNSLADRFQVSWKLLAKANKLRPPYTLKPGDRVRVPPKR